MRKSHKFIKAKERSEMAPSSVKIKKKSVRSMLNEESTLSDLKLLKNKQNTFLFSLVLLLFIGIVFFSLLHNEAVSKSLKIFGGLFLILFVFLVVKLFSDWVEFRDFLVSEIKNKKALPMFSGANSKTIEERPTTVVTVPNINGDVEIHVFIPKAIQNNWALLNNAISTIARNFSATNGVEEAEYMTLTKDGQKEIDNAFDMAYQQLGLIWNIFEKQIHDSLRKR